MSSNPRDTSFEASEGQAAAIPDLAAAIPEPEGAVGGVSDETNSGGGANSGGRVSASNVTDRAPPVPPPRFY